MTGLGWFDTGLPVLVPVFAFGSFCAAAIIGLHRLEWRRAVALGAAAVALWVVPFILLAQSNLLVGYNLIQPRYILPLMIIMLGVASATPRALTDWTVPRVIIVGGMLSAAAAVALHVNISRYTTGSDQPSVDPGSDAEWWWSGVPAPMTVWLVGSAAFALVFALLAVLQSAQRKAESTAPALESVAAAVSRARWIRRAAASGIRSPTEAWAASKTAGGGPSTGLGTIPSTSARSGNTTSAMPSPAIDGCGHARPRRSWGPRRLRTLRARHPDRGWRAGRERARRWCAHGCSAPAGRSTGPCSMPGSAAVPAGRPRAAPDRTAAHQQRVGEEEAVALPSR